MALKVGDILGGHAGFGEIYRRTNDARWAQAREIAIAALSVSSGGEE